MKIIQYWDNGVAGMPVLIRYLYEHNVALAQKLGFEIVLLTKENMRRYVKLPLGFGGLRPALQSDVVRHLMLHKYGGMWLDSDALLLKSPADDFQKFADSKYDLVAMAGDRKMESAAIMAKPNTVCTTAAVNALKRKKYGILKRAIGARKLGRYTVAGLALKLLKINLTTLNVLSLGPGLVTELCRDFPERTQVLPLEETKQTINFIFWRDFVYMREPDISAAEKSRRQHRAWLLESEDAAFQKAQAVFNGTFYVLTWRLYEMYRGKSKDASLHRVFGDTNSVLHHLVKLSRQNAGLE